MKAHFIYRVFLLLCLPLITKAQPKSHIVHYSPQDGLPQRTIMNILQDRKGFIWLATWDGLCKFDGHNFTNYKTTPEDTILMSNNRIDNLKEDAYGYIWLYTYNREPFRFDPKTEKYVATFRMRDKLFDTSRILIMPSGRVWLTSSGMGAICVLDSLNNHRLFSVGEGNLPDDKVNGVFEDSNGSAWTLTDGGLLKVSFLPGGETECAASYNVPDKSGNRTPFFSAMETEAEMWFGSNKGRIFSYNKSSKLFNVMETGVDSDIISICNVYDNLFVILTSGDGFFLCDRNLTNLKRFHTGNTELPVDEMLSCHIDGNNNIWIETNSKGIAKFNILENKLSYYMPNDYGNNEVTSPSFFLIEDKMGNIWVHPHGGFSFYDRKNDRLLPFFNNPHSSEWRFSDILHHANLDRQGNLWFCTRSGGLEKVVFDNTLFKLNDFYSNRTSITGSEVRAILEDSNNNIWLGNMNGTISVYTPDRNLKGYLCKDGTISKSGEPIKAMAYSFLQDSEGNIWIGSKGSGVFRLRPESGGNSFRIRQYVREPGNPYSLSNDAVYSIHEDASERKRIWIGTYGGGINLYDPEQDRFIHYDNELTNYPMDMGHRVRSIESFGGKVYVGTTLGLVVFDLEEQGRNIAKLRVYSKKYGVNDGLRANDIYNICVTKTNDIYIAAFGGGMCKVASRDADGFPLSFKAYDRSAGLHSDIVLTIVEDNEGLLWINSEGSMSRFNPADETFEGFNDVSRAISNQYFMETLPLLTSDNELIYGCSEGTLSFRPAEIKRNEYRPYLALIRFKVSNEDYLLTNQIDDTREVTLTHRENTFSIEYAALDYVNPQAVSYAYMLEGFDTDWIRSDKQRIAGYTNIPPGRYSFRVKSTNSNGTWTDNERRLSIVITPSFWQTNWALLLYIATGISILGLVFRSLFLFYRMRDKVKMEQEQTEMKTRFFTDISHEIRTPLTLIVSPIENILDNEKTHPEIKPQLQLILRNANRMLTMVNQILDFRKIQKRPLQVKETAIGTYIEDLCNSSLMIAESKNIRLVINNQIEDEKIWIDADAIEKLVVNLISNAIKHAGRENAESLTIEINLFGKEQCIVLQVKDDGQGMNKETMNKLFTRFASFSKDKSKPSAGIGLSIVKEIVDKHHARITVESDIDKGSSFTITFNTGLEHFANDNGVEIITSNDKLETKNAPRVQISAIEQDEKPEEVAEANPALSVLVVEDDTELRAFIKSLLADSYRVYEAGNGKEGYQAIAQHMPDFVLSDIMMPEMDGMELLHAVRSNPDISHIPFILLTAKTNIDDKLEGIKYGADDYITKPFSVKLLIARIENILKQRRLFANYLSSAGSEQAKEGFREFVVNNKITEQDEQFIHQLQQKVLSNLDNSELTIDDLVQSTTLSRRVFFNKMKSLTGMAPVEFVRDIRMKRAGELLRTREYRVKEVVYMVGYLDIRYFIKCFKSIYGMTPSQYMESHQAGADSGSRNDART